MLQAVIMMLLMSLFGEATFVYNFTGSLSSSIVGVANFSDPVCRFLSHFITTHSHQLTVTGIYLSILLSQNVYSVVDDSGLIISEPVGPSLNSSVIIAPVTEYQSFSDHVDMAVYQSVTIDQLRCPSVYLCDCGDDDLNQCLLFYRTSSTSILLNDAPDQQSPTTSSRRFSVASKWSVTPSTSSSIIGSVGQQRYSVSLPIIEMGMGSSFTMTNISIDTPLIVTKSGNSSELNGAQLYWSGAIAFNSSINVDVTIPTTITSDSNVILVSVALPRLSSPCPTHLE
jgi:hypothetical protein